MKNLLIIFVKNPVLGKVKTRLAKSIGEKNALLVYEKLLKRTKEIAANLLIDKRVCYSEFIGQDDLWNNNSFQKKMQKGNDLGEKMYNAFKDAFADSYNNICLIGSDNMELTDEIILQAFSTLSKKDIVLGPSLDGGYYLIGMKRPHKELFFGKTWGSSKVFYEAVDEITRMNLDHALLPALNDIDQIEDIKDEDRAFLLP